MYHLHHFTGGDFEHSGKLIEFNTIQEARYYALHWDDDAMTSNESLDDWRIHDEDHQIVDYVVD